MKKILFLFFLFLVYSSSINAQQNDLWDSQIEFNVKASTPLDFFETMDLEYTPVKGLFLDNEKFDDLEPFTNEPCATIQSDDKQFITFIEVSFSFKSSFTFDERNGYLHKHIKYHLDSIAKKYDQNNNDELYNIKKVCPLSEEKDKKIFHADNVVHYTLPVVKTNNYSITKINVEYTHCEVIAIHKNNIGPVFFYCFFSDKGYVNREKHLSKLKKSFRFKK